MRAFFSLALALSLCCTVPAALAATATGPDTPATEPASTNGHIGGTVADPTGAVIPNAIVTATRTGHTPLRTTSDAAGRYSFSNLAPGTYILEASEAGFQTAHVENVRIVAGGSVTVTLTLAIASDQQSVVVSADEPDTAPEKNGGAIVLKGENLAALSDDPDELSQQLQMIAGADAETGSQIYVDGFTAGKLPPKNAIREIRINSNPYSAQYDQLGFGRIEILTKPGEDKLHGDLWAHGNNSPWNAQNPFVKTQPPYYEWEMEGDVDGPVTKNSSYFFTLWTQHAINNSIVNAQILDSSLNPVSYTQAVSVPSTNLYLTPRFDWQWGNVHTFSVRYQLSRISTTNSGIGQFALQSQAFNSTNTEQILQLSDSQAWSPKTLNEAHFQYTRDRNSQLPYSTDPTIAVQGAFTSGGVNTGTQRDAQDHYEIYDLLRLTRGTHDINVGARLRITRDSNYSTANYNGSYTFADMTHYQITEQGMALGWTPAQIRAAGGGASLFTQTHGTPSIVVDMADVGGFAEDNWKIIPSVTFSYGLRFESQTGISDHEDFAPRFGIAWSIPGGTMPDTKGPDGKVIKGGPKPPIAIIRAGGGLFYTRFASTGLLQAERQNGITQSAVVINNPDFYPGTCTTDPEACEQNTDNASAPTIFSLSPTLRAPYLAIAGVGVDKQLFKKLSLSVNYLYTRGLHQFVTRNINAPLPGTYNPNDPTSGTRPLGVFENIYQYGSEGFSERNRINVNVGLNVKNGGFWGNYMFSRANADTGGMGSFPSNQYDLGQDWGRASWDIHNRVFAGGYTRLPQHFTFNSFLMYQSSQPFNIVVGEDLNGDSQFNDRPTFATDMTRPSVYRTKWGNFDADPLPGQQIIPINYGTGPGVFSWNARLNRQFNFGPPLPKDEQPQAPPQAANAKPGAQKKPAKPLPIMRKYTLGLAVQAQNVLNHPNYSQPIGVLGSSLFGQSTAMNNTNGNSTPGRSIAFETFFRF